MERVLKERLELFNGLVIENLGGIWIENIS